MPKLKDDKTHTGCRVHGVYRQANGQPMQAPITVAPGRAGTWNGATYDKTPIILMPDKDGAYEIVLPPSSALGDYTVTFGEHPVVIRVPDNVSEATLLSLVVT